MIRALLPLFPGQEGSESSYPMGLDRRVAIARFTKSLNDEEVSFMRVQVQWHVRSGVLASLRLQTKKLASSSPSHLPHLSHHISITGLLADLINVNLPKQRIGCLTLYDIDGRPETNRR